MLSYEEILGRLASIEQLVAEIRAGLEQPAPPVVVPDKPLAGLQNTAAFFDYVRGDKGELFPTLSQSQLDGMSMTLHMASGVLPLCWCAYVLATEYHETNKTMQPVKEAYWLSEDWRKTHLPYYPWYGRGKAEITWEKNYRFATKRLTELGVTGVDLIANPDQALDPVIATKILIVGMLEGWFTGKALRDFIPAVATRVNYKNCRQVVNGHDDDDLIAGYAIEFEKGLRLGDWR
jgi:putative chitinase